MGVWGSGVLVMVAMATASVPSLVPIPTPPPGSRPPVLEPERPAESPAPGTLIHPLRIDLGAPGGGWQLTRLEILLDGALLAERPLTSAAAIPAEGEEAWSGPLAGGEHVLTAVVVLRRPASGPQPAAERRVERARRFQSPASEAVALLVVQTSAGTPALELAAR